jgi:bifunctional enzyme CysN/CysC
MRAALALKPELDLAPPATSPALGARSLLRFITCGSVDDGKSTLLGRLLWETGSVFEDQSEALARDSERFGTNGKALDYALLVDGLSAEREQGITIDVAYRYFSTPRRAFIAADTPGHEQYTRNMATGASTADAAIILVDARKGLLPQTRRHSYIVSMIGVRDVIIAVNKMDLVGYDEAIFRAIERDYRALVPTLGFTNVHVVPLSAREGDNLAARSGRMPWYAGPDLLSLLETIEPVATGDAKFRLPVQWVNRPNADFRGFSGTIASGEIRVGDEISTLPRGQTSRIAGILTPSGPAQAARGGEAVTVTLSSEIDISRGDVITAASSAGTATHRASARLLALTEDGVAPGKGLIIKLATATTGARLGVLHHLVDVHQYENVPAGHIPLNGIGVATVQFESPLAATTYAECRTLGSFLLIDPVTNSAVALGVIDRIEAEARIAPEPPLPASTPRRALIAFLARHGILPPAPDAEAIRRYLGWRLLSALLVALVILAATGSPLWAALAALIDIPLRPLARIGSDAGFARFAAYRRRRAQDALSIDGGGI